MCLLYVLLSKYYQYYSISGVAPRKMWGGPNIIVSPTFQSGDEARVGYSPIILSTELLLTFYTLFNYRRGHSLKFAKKEERFFAIGVQDQGRGTCACTY